MCIQKIRQREEDEISHRNGTGLPVVDRYRVGLEESSRNAFYFAYHSVKKQQMNKNFRKMEFIQLLFIISSFALFLDLALAKEVKDLPKGHGEELGKHRDSDGHVDVLTTIPSPQDFWDNYASIRKPVVFRGAAKNFPAQSLWTDNYLKKKYGNLEVKLEAKKEKDHVPVGDRGLGRDTIKSFLDSYVEKDSYMVSQLPDPLAKEVRVLPCLMCGTFSERILEANLWLSSGGTKSMLHKDADNAINCLLNGTKDWILIHPDNEENVS